MFNWYIWVYGLYLLIFILLTIILRGVQINYDPSSTQLDIIKTKIIAQPIDYNFEINEITVKGMKGLIIKDLNNTNI